MSRKPRSRTFQPLAPERLSLLKGQPLATFQARAGAFLLDFVIVVLLCFPVGLLLRIRDIVQNPNIHIDIHIDPFHSWWGLLVLVLYFGLSKALAEGLAVAEIGTELQRSKAASASCNTSFTPTGRRFTTASRRPSS